MRHILRNFYGSLWAIDPDKYLAMREVVNLYASGARFTPDEIHARIGEPKRSPVSRSSQGTVAVLPLFGIISQRMNLITQSSGGTSTELFGRAFDDAVADSSVTAIAIDVDSPGGNVSGTPELAAKIRAARGTKPIVAVSNSFMASAAYWIASQADEIWASPSSETGSIGVLCEHVDASAAYEKEGLRPTIIKAGEHKAEFTDTAPLSADARAELQRRVDETYAMFVRDVALGRRVSEAIVRQRFGKGRTLGAKDALAAGMVDHVGSFEQAVGKLLTNGQANGLIRTGNALAQADADQLSLLLARHRDRGSNHAA
jgi:capsid assembly protease